MLKKAFFLFFSLMILPFISKTEENLFQFECIKYPKEIVIPKDWKKAGLDIEMEIFYKYKGSDIIIISESEVENIISTGNLHGGKFTYIEISLQYIKKMEKSFPKQRNGI